MSLSRRALFGVASAAALAPFLPKADKVLTASIGDGGVISFSHLAAGKSALIEYTSGYIVPAGGWISRAWIDDVEIPIVRRAR